MGAYPEYVERKHRIFFQYLDLDADGKLYRKDFLNRVERISTLNDANEEESANTRYRWMKYANFVFQCKDDEYLTEDTYVKRHREIWSSDLKYEMSLLLCGIYDVLLDADRDGQISKDELKAYYKSIGSATKEFTGKVFTMLDEDKDGRLTKHEFMKAGELFWFGEDSSTCIHMMYDVHN